MPEGNQARRPDHVSGCSAHVCQSGPTFEDGYLPSFVRIMLKHSGADVKQRHILL